MGAVHTRTEKRQLKTEFARARQTTPRDVPPLGFKVGVRATVAWERQCFGRQGMGAAQRCQAHAAEQQLSSEMIEQHLASLPVLFYRQHRVFAGRCPPGQPGCQRAR